MNNEPIQKKKINPNLVAAVTIPFFTVIMIIFVIMPAVREEEDQVINANTNQPTAECSVDADCQTPSDYLIQSRCPFDSGCIEGQCEVICPLSRHDPDLNISKSYPITCSTDSDCDCSGYLANDLKECKCQDNKCVVVIDQEIEL